MTSLVLRNFGFILESIAISNFTEKFQVFLKVENYEWLEVGVFQNSDLPTGLNFAVLISEEWLKAPEIEIRLEMAENVFEGILELEESLMVKGVAKLYSCEKIGEEIEIGCTIFVDEIGNKEKEMRNEETQTVKGRKDDVECQTDAQPNPKICEASTNTDANFVDFSNFEKILKVSVAEKLRKIKAEMATTSPKPVEIEDPRPSEIPCENLLKSHNLVPRMTRLKQLDQMIVERERMLMELDSEIEIRKKMVKIMEKRKEIRKEKHVKFEEPKVMENSETSLVLEKIEEEEEEESSEKSSSEESSEISEDSEDSDDTESEKSEASKHEMSEIEDPFSPKKKEEVSILSPTSEYLEKLRKRVQEKQNNS